MRKALPIINLLLGAAVAAAAAFTVREALLFKYGPSETAPRAAKAPRAATMPSAAVQLSDYAEIVESGIFGKGAIPAGAASAEGGQAASDLALTGTAEGADYAIFMDMRTGRQKPFKTGESVFGTGQVAEIGTRRAVLVLNGKRTEFKVSQSALPYEPAPAKSLSTGMAAKKEGEGQWTVDQRAVSGVFENLDKVLTDARVVPYIENSKLSGFQIKEIKPGGVFSQLGLQDGDVLQTINGNKLESPDKVAQVLGGLRGETEIDLEIIRNRQPKRLQYRVR